MADEDPREAIQRAIEQASAGIAYAAHILTAQGAMGWMIRGDIVRARKQLVKLPPDILEAVSVSAAALSGLADEIRGETAA